MEDHSTEPAKKPDRMDLLRLWQEQWEALEDCRIREQQVADAGLLVQPLIPGRVRLSRQSLAVITELRRTMLQELLEQIAAVEQSTSEIPRQKEDVENRPEKPLPDKLVTETLKELDRTTTMLQGLCAHSWYALEHCRIGEELLDENGIDTHSLAGVRAQLSNMMLSFVREEHRSENVAFFIRHVVSSGSFPPAPLPAAARHALKELLKEFSLKDRRVLRQILDRAQPAEVSSSAERS